MAGRQEETLTFVQFLWGLVLMALCGLAFLVWSTYTNDMLGVVLALFYLLAIAFVYCVAMRNP